MNTLSRRLAALALLSFIAAAIHHLAADPGDVQPFILTQTGPTSQRLSWTSQPGARYVVQVSDDLGGWDDVDVVTSTGTTTIWNDPYPRIAKKEFYRLVTPQTELRSIEPAVVSSSATTVVYFLGQCFTGTEKLYINGTLFVGVLTFDSATQLHATIPALAVGNYKFLITSSTGAPTYGPAFGVISTGSGRVTELPPTPAPGVPNHSWILAGRETPWLSKNGLKKGITSVDGGAIPDFHVPGVHNHFNWTRTHRYRSPAGTTSAMGAKWDFSYNIRARLDAPGFVTVYDGNGRADTYEQQTGGLLTCRGRFETGALSGGGTVFTLTFPDGGKWEFGAFGALPTLANEGKISAIRDRNNNAITFTYDAPTGRLTTITDTLSRNYTLAYDGAGYIASLTDFMGRAITYVHDAAGDLTVVRSPAVIGTPNGNDFPTGKTTTYTYSTGFPDPALNHNLLTVTDGLGQTPVVLTYAPTLVPTAVEYNRVTRVQFGSAGQDTVFSYDALTPSPANRFATLRAYVNDANGHLTEYEYDSLNRPVRVRTYTGACIAGSAATAGANRPGSQLRAGDPAYYDTLYAWDADSLCTKVTMPRGNTIEYFHEGDLRAAGTVAAGKIARMLMVRQRAEVAGVYDQDEIIGRFVHDDRFGSDGIISFPTQIIDGRGYATLCTYDMKGNLLSTDRGRSVASPASPPSGAGVIELCDLTYSIRGQCVGRLNPDNGSGHRRLDTFTYDPGTGQLASVTCDSGELNLLTQYQYDAFGNLIRLIDPRGNDSLITRNALNQPVRIESRSAGLAGRGRMFIYYDANNNVVRTDTANKDQNGAVGANAEFTTAYTFDILNRVLDSTAEIDAVTTATTRRAYDAEGNLTDILSPLAVAGIQPLNTIHFINDETDKPFRITFGLGDPGQSTTQYDYNANGSCTTCTQGLEGTPLVWKIDTDPFSTGGYEEPLDPNYDPTTGAGFTPGVYIPGRSYRPPISTPGTRSLPRLWVEPEPTKPPPPNPFLMPNENSLFGKQGRSGSLVAINESCSPISQLVFTQIGVGGGGLLWDPPFGGPALPPVFSGPAEPPPILWDPPIGGGPIPPNYSGGVDTSGWLIDPERPPFPPVPIDFGSGSSASPAPGSSGVALPLPFPFPGERHEGLPPLPKKSEEYIYDALSRKVKYPSLGGRPIGGTDPMGNTFEYHYDASGNPTRVITRGELNDQPGSTNNVRLGERTIVFDPLNRPLVVNTAHFNPATGLNIGDGQSTTTFVWTNAGGCQSVTDDRGNSTNWLYDGAGRPASRTDAKGNVISCTRDANGNVLTMTSTEKSDIGSADQVFITTFGYDERDHVTLCTYPSIGNTESYGYDSRGVLRIHTDARGIADFWLPDGLCRTTLQFRDMDNSGTLTAADIQRTKTYDANSRIVSITDDNGHATTRTHDALNRCFRVTSADGTQTNVAFDVHGNVTLKTDANGTQVLTQFDLNNRPVQLQIIPGAGVMTTTQQQAFSYDGRGLTVAAMTAGAGFAGPINHQSTLSYDSHGNWLTDTQDGLTAAQVCDGTGHCVSLTHPTGRVVLYTRDALNRVSTINDGAPVAQIFYIGSRTERILNGNGTRTDYTYDGVNGVANAPGDFGFRQIARMQHFRVSDGLVIDDHSFAWDRAQNKIQRKDLRIGGPQLTHTYGLDPGDRHVFTQVTTAAAAVVRQTNYQIDGEGNRINVNGPGTPNPGPYTMNAGAPLFDFEVNQYTNTPFGGQTHSNAGETTNFAGAQYFYDAFGALVAYQPAGQPQPTATYEMNALGQRVKRTLNPAGAAQATTFGYAGGTLVSEIPAAGAPKDFVCIKVDADPEMTPREELVFAFAMRGPVNVFIHTDDQGNTMAESNAAGALAQSFEYGDFGLPNAVSAAGNPFLFCRMYYDNESGLYDEPGLFDRKSAGHLSPPVLGSFFDTFEEMSLVSIPQPKKMDPKTGRRMQPPFVSPWNQRGYDGGGRRWRGFNDWRSPWTPR